MLRLLADATIMFCVLRLAACCEFTVKQLDEKNSLLLNCSCRKPPPEWLNLRSLNIYLKEASETNVLLGSVNYNYKLGVVSDLYNNYPHITTKISSDFDPKLQHAHLELRFNKTGTLKDLHFNCRVDGFNARDNHKNTTLNASEPSDESFVSAKTSASPEINTFSPPTTDTLPVEETQGSHVTDDPKEEPRTAVYASEPSAESSVSAKTSASPAIRNTFSPPTTDTLPAEETQGSHVTDDPKEESRPAVYASQDQSTLLLVCLISVCTVFAIILIFGTLLCFITGKGNRERHSEEDGVIARFDLSAGGSITPEAMGRLLSFVTSNNVAPRTSAPARHAKCRQQHPPLSVTSVCAVTSPYSEYSNISEISDCSLTHPVCSIVFENELSFFSDGDVVSCVDETERKERPDGLTAQLLRVPQDGQTKGTESSSSTSAEFWSALSSHRQSDSISADLASTVTSQASSGLTATYRGPAAPETSNLNSHSPSVFYVQSSALTSESPALTRQPSVVKSSAFNTHSFAQNLQSSAANAKSSALNSPAMTCQPAVVKSSALTPHSLAMNPQSSAVDSQWSAALSFQPSTLNHHQQSVLSSQRTSALKESRARALSSWQAEGVICDTATSQITGPAGQEEVASHVTAQQSSAQAQTAPKHCQHPNIFTVPKHRRSELPLPTTPAN